MRQLALAFVVVGTIGLAASAQIWQDPFNYPNGTNLGAWQEYNGDWNAVNSMAECAQVSQWQYCTQPNLLYKDCAAEVVGIYNANSKQALQFSGPAIRCGNPGSGSLGSDLIMAKIQGSGRWTNLYLYELNATGGSKILQSTSFTGGQQGIVRLLGIDQRVVLQADTTGDGLWDYVFDQTTTVTAKGAPVGIDGYGGGQVDDFKLWDGVCLRDVNNPKPTPGASMKYVMRGWPGAAFQAAISLGNTGIVLPDGRVIPLTADGLFFASVFGAFPGFAGLLDGNGDGTVTFAIPKIPALVGVTYYFAFVNYSTSGILNISNDEQTTITT
jgi:hypothetical protein